MKQRKSAKFKLASKEGTKTLGPTQKKELAQSKETILGIGGSEVTRNFSTSFGRKITDLPIPPRLHPPSEKQVQSSAQCPTLPHLWLVGPCPGMCRARKSYTIRVVAFPWCRGSRATSFFKFMIAFQRKA